MANNVRNHVINSIPSFIKKDHPLFDAFIAAYYEYLESTGDSEHTSRVDLHKSLPKPAGIVNNDNTLKDPDDALEQFLEFFEYDVVETSLENLATNRRFILKKLRDLYLAKGTPKSFKLFFKLFFNEEIEIYEAKDTILRPSDGKYFKFSTGYFYVDDRRITPGDIADFDFVLAELYDSEEGGSLIAQTIAGVTIDRNSLNQPILQLQFSEEVNLNAYKGKRIRLVDTADVNNYMYIVPMLTINDIKLDTIGSLYEPNDLVTFKSINNQKSFTTLIEDVNYGSVTSVKMRGAGINYNFNDVFRFQSLDPIYGSGGHFSVTEVDPNGYGIVGLNGYNTRTGINFNGWLANALEDVEIPISTGGDWKKLPTIGYYANPNALEVGEGLPYWEPHTDGYGVELTPLSTTIGVPNSFLVTQLPYFYDSDDVRDIVPWNIVVENNNNLSVGQTVSFQTFISNDPGDSTFGPLDEDSEYFTYTFGITRQYITRDTDSDNVQDPSLTGSITYGSESYNDPWVSYLDSEFSPVEPRVVTVPIGYDSDLFIWNTKEFVINDKTDSDGLDLVLNYFLSGFDGIGTVSSGSTRYSGTISLKEFNIEWSFDSEETILDSYIESGSNPGFEAPGSNNNIDINIDGRDFGNTADSLFFDVYDGGIYSDSDDLWGKTLDQTQNKRLRKTLKLKYSGWWINQLEDYHISQLPDYTVSFDSEMKYQDLEVDTMIHLLPWLTADRSKLALRDWGTWEDIIDSDGIEYKGIIVKLNEYNGVVQLSEIDGHDMITMDIVDSFSRAKHNIVRLNINDDSDYNDFHFPLKNILHDVQHATIKYDLGVINSSNSSFRTADGWLSTSYGANLHDNWRINDYAYSIKSDIPVNTWLKRFKTMLHPAGMVLSALYNDNLEAVVDSPNPDSMDGDARDSGLFSFDADNDYISDNVLDVVTAGNIWHTVNSFETQNSPGTPLTADHYDYDALIGRYQQTGNSWFDMEPLGLVSEETTQIADNSGNVINHSTIYERWDNHSDQFYKNDSRLVRFGEKWRTPTVQETYFNEYVTDIHGNNVQYEAYTIDSENLIYDNAWRFIDSDLVMEDLNYESVISEIGESTDKSWVYHVTNKNVDRKKELLENRYSDLITALKGNSSFKFRVGDKIYEDLEAYNLKWNTIHSDRTINTQGWKLQDYTRQWVGHENIRRNTDYAKGFTGEPRPSQYMTVKNPEGSYDIKIKEGHVWTTSYPHESKINTVPEKPDPIQTDIDTLMKNRRNKR